jgi:hypothetical protein
LRAALAVVPLSIISFWEKVETAGFCYLLWFESQKFWSLLLLLVMLL